MSQSDYIFVDTQFESELTRLQQLEKAHDRLSQGQILATGITTGWQCLEIGVGAGSIMRWMSKRGKQLRQTLKPTANVPKILLLGLYISLR